MSASPTKNDTQADPAMDRFSRQMRLAHIGEDGQRAILNARVLIVGIGGLGSPVALYLAAAGVGHLVISDFDRVELSNLQRQIAHAEDQLGETKVASAASAMRRLNSGCRLDAIDRQLDGAELFEQVRLADVVIDCSDNFATRFELNAAAHSAGTPLVSGAAIRMEGQVVTFFPDQGPCYRCLFPDTEGMAESCEMEGVLGPVVGVIGSMQALMALNVIVGRKTALLGRIWLFDALSMVWRELRLSQDPSCPVCADRR